MQKAATKRLMEHLTGKETFAAIMQSYADMIQQKPPTYDDEALDRAKASLAKRPHDEREFYRWCNAKGVIDFLAAEIRVDAMQANWCLSTALSHSYAIMFCNAIPIYTPEKVSRQCLKIQRLLQKLAHYLAALDAFGDALNVDLNPLLHHGMEALNEYLLLYGNMADLFDEHLTAESGFTVITTGYLPTLALALSDEAKQKQADLTKALQNYHGDAFASLLVPMVETI